jgi:C4-dicarboxylate transporter DctM subunit
VGTSGLGRNLANLITSVGLSPWLIVIAINAIYLILGFFMDSISVMMITLPFLVPIIKGLGFDPIWFGVVTVVNIEIGLITPPMALNIFTAKEVFGLPLGELIRYLIPFLAVLVIFLGIIIAFPQLSLWLPAMMRG